MADRVHWAFPLVVLVFSVSTSCNHTHRRSTGTDGGVDAGGDAGLPDGTLLDGGPADDWPSNDTLTGKIMAGYQGWFYAEGDGSGAGWRHWGRGSRRPGPDSITIDMWPDVSEYDPDELFDTDFRYRDGSVAQLYSAYTEKTVVRHTEWMRDAGIDGVFVQRFLSNVREDPLRSARDQTLNNIRVGCELNGCVFVNMYDISDADDQDWVENLKRDWMRLVDEMHLTQSPRYLRHRGRPLLAIWGFGNSSRPGTPEQATDLIEWLTEKAAERYRVTLMGGIPHRWRYRGSQVKPDPDWDDVFRSLDVISPWAVGRYRDQSGADNYREGDMREDRAECERLGIDYLPVVFPGFSRGNLKESEEYNVTPRLGGRFLWRQLYNAIAEGNEMIYVAMFDEVDEGTAIFKVTENSSHNPVDARLISLDVDGESLPSDWYLRLVGTGGQMLRGDLQLTAAIPISP